MWVKGPNNLGNLLLLSQLQYQGAGLEVEELGFKAVLQYGMPVLQEVA